MKDHDGDLLDDYSSLQQYNSDLLSDEDILKMRRLEAEEYQKVAAYKQIHSEFAKDTEEIRKREKEERQKAEYEKKLEKQREKILKSNESKTRKQSLELDKNDKNNSNSII